MLPKKLPRVLRSATHARGGGGSVPLRSAPFRSVPAPFRYAMAARVLRSVPRARRHYTRARARCAAAFAPLHYARRGARGYAESYVPLRDGGARSPFRSASAAALHSRTRSLRRRVRSTPLRPQGGGVRRHYTRARARCAAARHRPSPLCVPFRECGGTTLALLVAPPPSLHYTHSGERRHRRRPPRANCSAVLRKLRGAGVGFPPLHSALRSTPRAPSPLGVPFRESGGITRFARYTAALAPLHAKRGAPPPPPPPRKLLRCATQIARGGRLRYTPLRLHSATLRYTPLHYAPAAPCVRSGAEHAR